MQCRPSIRVVLCSGPSISGFPTRSLLDMIQWRSITRGGRSWNVSVLKWDYQRSSPRAVRPHSWLPPPMQNTTWAPTIQRAFTSWKFEREKQMTGETKQKPEETANGTQGMTRREAMLQLLRLSGAAVGAAGVAAWLSEHSFRPVPAKAEDARPDHRIAAHTPTPI